MSILQTIVLIVILSSIAYFSARNKANRISATKRLHSLPNHYGYLAVFVTLVPFILIFMFWSFAEITVVQKLVIAKFPYLQELSLINLAAKFSAIESGQAVESAIYLHYLKISNILKIVVSSAFAILGYAILYLAINYKLKARNIVESIILFFLITSATIAILTTIGIISSVLFESFQFFRDVPLSNFLFDTHWSPQIAIREDQAASSGAFGAVPLFWGTLFISFIAIIIAAPIGLTAAIYLSEYATNGLRNIVKPFLEILAGVPTVVYGFFAAITMGPIFRDLGNFIKELGYSLDINIVAGMVVSTESVLAAGVVMGMMIVPFVLSLSEDVIAAVPEAMRDGSIALGATKSETVNRILIPAALPGVIGSILLAISRAVGETMIVLMAAGLAAKLTANPFDSVTTITVQIVTLLTGDQEFDSVKTLAAFALGLGLFVITLGLNIIALKIVQKYREQYE